MGNIRKIAAFNRIGLKIMPKKAYKIWEISLDKLFIITILIIFSKNGVLFSDFGTVFAFIMVILIAGLNYSSCRRSTGEL